MPQYCCIYGCSNRKGGHLFPVSPTRQLKWRVAVARQGRNRVLWMPNLSSDVICSDHFKETDYLPNKQRKILKHNAVPSVFSFRPVLPKQPDIDRSLRAERRKRMREISLAGGAGTSSCNTEDICMDSIVVGANEVVREEDFFTADENCTGSCNKSRPKSVDSVIQCCRDQTNTPFSVQGYSSNSSAIQYFTGFEDYEHFRAFLALFMPYVDRLEHKSMKLSVEDQLFLTLLKLRQDPDHKFLSFLFGIGEATVSNIFCAWIDLIYSALKAAKRPKWPSRNVVNETMPAQFKKDFPSTRVIIDTTEIPVEKPSNVNAQCQTFSTYKNRNTLKVLVGITPRGAVSFISDCYGGSASDREIIENCDLYKNVGQLFDDGDSIMCDRGFPIQDLFAPHNICINMPSFLKGKHQFEPHEIFSCRKIASQRIHVERVIGFAKTMKILQNTLPYRFLYLGNKIVFVCFVLCNFRRSIVHGD